MKIFLVLLLISFSSGQSLRTIDKIEQITDSTSSSDHIALVFIDKKLCVNELDDKCQEQRRTIDRLKEIFGHEQIELVSSTNEEIIGKDFHLYGSQTKLVFFRENFPIVYPGAISDFDAVREWFNEVRTRFTRTLNDQNFEHDTQAATGSTTGDWFILFKNSNNSRGLIPLWESLSIRFRNRVIFGYVDLDKSPLTQKRFHLFNVPVFILFKRGKFYRYESVSWKETSFVDFVDHLYAKSKAEPVPPELSVFSSYFDNFPKAIPLYLVVIPMICLLAVLLGLSTGIVKKKKPTDERPPIQVKID